MRGPVLLIVLVTAGFLQPVPSGAPAARWPETARHFDVQAIARDVYAVVRKDSPGFAFESNSLVVVAEREALVVDAQSNLTTTRAVIDAVRALTDRPVKYLVNTHAHDDHVTGNQAYREHFPGVEIVAHREGREDMETGAVRRRQEFQAELPKTIAFFRAMLEKNVGFDGSPLTAEERDAYTSDVALADGYATLPAGFVPTPPSVTFDDRLIIHLGAREVQVLRLGRGHSMGDAVVYLPQERVLATGDLVVSPIPLIGTLSYPVDYAVTMQRVLDLGARTILPGHGPVLKDDAHVKVIAALTAAVRDQASAAIARGDTLEVVRKTVTLDSFRTALAGESKLRNLLFTQYVAGPALTRAYEQLTTR